MTKQVTIVVPFCLNKLWLQSCISSLKENTDPRRADIVVVDNSTSDRLGEDIKVLTETSLGDGIQIVNQGLMLSEGRPYTTHAAALNYMIPRIKTPYMFSCESDVIAKRHGWLDWYFSFMDDGSNVKPAPMVGWYWPVRGYIAPGMTLFDMHYLRKIDAEVWKNKSTVIRWADDFTREKEGLEELWKMLIENGLMGPFNEMRGYSRNPFTGDIEKHLTRDDHDTGSWLYRRLSEEFELREVPGIEIANIDWQQRKVAPTKYQYIGDAEDEAYLIHYSAGTVSHDYQKHTVSVPWQTYCLEFWLRREYDTWKEVVPEHIRRETINKGLVPDLQKEVEMALSRIHIK